MADIKQEVQELITLIRNETKREGNTKERVADTLDGLIALMDSKFLSGGKETLTRLEDPKLEGDICYFKYKAEDGQVQTVSVDLSALKAPSNHITGVVFNDDPWILGISESNDNLTEVDLSDVKLVLEIDGAGIGTFIQNGYEIAKISKVARTGKYSDLIDLPPDPSSQLGSKLDKTTTTVVAPDSTFKYVYLTDVNNNTRRMLAGDLGKNIANSSLTSVVGAGMTQGANFNWSTAGYYFNILGLTDKSSDITFNKFLVQNTSGQVATTNGKQMMTTLPSLLNDQEKNTWKTEMNGGWTTNTMSVAIISPPIVDRQDKPYWINLRGANLNVNPASFKIEICTGASSTAATATVIAEIPNSQIQLYTNGTDLTFYYNFKDIVEGTYKLRIWNGVAYYLTSFTLNVVTHVNRVDLTNVIWSKKIYNNATSPTIVESGSSVSYSSDPSVKALADDSSFIAGRKSNQLIAADEDFYMTVEVTGTTSDVPSASGLMTHFVGLVNADTTVDLLNQTVVSLRAVQQYWFPFTSFFPDNSTSSIGNNTNNYGLTVIFMRRGGSWTVIITHNNQTLLYTKTGYTGAIAFGMYNQNTRVSTTINANIVELYKF